jgi:hypothetical protein
VRTNQLPCIAALALIGIIVGACSRAPEQSTDLTLFDAPYATCRELREAVRPRMDIARTLLLTSRREPLRSASVGIDSLGRLRTATVMQTTQTGTKSSIHMASGMFEPDGRLKLPTRTMITRNSANGTGNSNTVPMAGVDTAKLRAMANDVLRLCSAQVSGGATHTTGDSHPVKR